MDNILTKETDSIIVSKKQPGTLNEIDSGNEVVASISNDEIILHNDYEIKIVPAHS